VPPLKIHIGLVSTAQKWAEYLAENSSGIIHGKSSADYTENIHAYYGKNEMCGIMDAIVSW